MARASFLTNRAFNIDMDKLLRVINFEIFCILSREMY